MVDNYAARTVRGVRGILMQSFDLANQLGLMQGNPAVGVKLPKIRRRGRKDERYGCWLIRLDSFVFTNRKTRKPYTYTGFRAVYYHFLERNGLKECHLNLHSYRHTFATMLVEAGMNPKVVQSQLGHTSVNTTLGVSTHITPALSESVSVALEHVYQQMNA